MHNIHKLKDMLMEELEEYGEKGELTPGSLDVVDKLAHSVKNICKIIDDCEGEEGYSNGRYYYRDGTHGGSYARNRRRDTMGRYSRAEDGMDDLLTEMHEIMPMLPEEKRREAQRFVDKMRSM
jgi:hypothetical protein